MPIVLLLGFAFTQLNAPSSFPSAESVKQEATQSSGNTSLPIFSNTPLTPPGRPSSGDTTPVPISPQAQTATSPATAVPTGIMVGPNQVLVSGALLEIDKRKDVMISANVQGKLMELKLERRDAVGQLTKTDIREGVFVKAGDVLGFQDDRMPQAALVAAQMGLKIAEAEAQKKIEVEYARHGANVARIRVAKNAQLNEKQPGIVPDMEVREAELQSRQADANYDLSVYNLDVVKVAELEAKKALVAEKEVAVELQRFNAPFDGMIVEVKRTEGEWLREGDPILRIIQLDTLRLRGKVDAKRYKAQMVENRAVTVYAPDTSGNMVAFPARIVFANPIVQAGDVFDVHIDVQNRQVDGHWQLQPGLMIDAVIHLDP